MSPLIRSYLHRCVEQGKENTAWLSTLTSVLPLSDLHQVHHEDKIRDNNNERKAIKNPNEISWNAFQAHCLDWK